MAKRIDKNVVFLGFTSLFTDISTEMITRVLPLFLEQLGAGGAIIGLIEGIAESVSSFVKIASGYISDRFQNRKVLTFLGYAESAIAKLFLVFASSPLGVMLIRAFERVGKGIRTAPRDALISSYATSENTGLVFGFHRAMDTLGATIGPLLAILLLSSFGSENYRVVFKFALLPAFVALLFLLLVKEKKIRRLVAEQKKINGSFKLGRKFYIYVAATTLFTVGNSSDAFITLYAGRIGASTTTILWMWIVHTLAYGVLSTPFGALSDFIGRKKTIIFGYAVYAISYLAFAFTRDVAFLYFDFLLYSVYYALSEGAQKAFVADLVQDSSLRGTAYGIYNFGVGIMAFPASIIAGILFQYVAPAAPFFFGGIIAAAASILILLV